MFIGVNPISYKDLNSKRVSETSKCIRQRIEVARKIQKDRFKNEAIYCNAQMNDNLLKKYCKLDIQAESIIEKIYEKFKISARGYSRILKVSRTIADLKNRNNISKEDVIEALQYRKFIDRNIV
ncbi:MAG: hypothetical protein E7210_18585 [Clostridium lundense]|nr:hypothetical protein [Clostridium thermopalmarium]MBE6042645.1 hypothetical protein [Clostridium thermopalmarium]MBE6079054.1 hypothetical protein [Clostridium lundense]